MRANGYLQILLDTTYLLPSFGIRVKELTINDLIKLRELFSKPFVEVYYSPIVWIEILGKISRELLRTGVKETPGTISLAFKSIIETRYYKPIMPSPSDLELALKLRLMGHRDNIDNILYAIAYNRDMILMSMDYTLKQFLKKHKLRYDIVKSHVEILEYTMDNRNVKA